MTLNRKRFGDDVVRAMSKSLGSDDLGGLLPDGGERAFVTQVGAARRGMASLRDHGPVAYLWGLYVFPAAQRRGLGQALVAAASGCVRRSHGIEVRVLRLSSPAVRFYERLGFRTTGTEAFELVPGARADALVMYRQAQAWPASPPDGFRP